MLRDPSESAHWRTIKAILREVRRGPLQSAANLVDFLRWTLADYLSLMRTFKKSAGLRQTLADSSGHFKSAKVWWSPPNGEILADCGKVCWTVAESAKIEIKP